ncbi:MULTISPECIES: hypothetical protein [Sphingobium]|nr:hypothetical protein [Sphingobium sp. MI1205]
MTNAVLNRPESGEVATIQDEIGRITRIQILPRMIRESEDIRA